MKMSLRALTLAAALVGAAATGTKAPTATPKPGKHSKAHDETKPRTKNVQLCLDETELGFVASAPDAANSYTGEAAFAATVYNCDSYDSTKAEFTEALGELAWNCHWADKALDPADQLVPCTGLITLASSAKVASKKPLSTGAFAFWIAEDVLLGADILNAEIVEPTVLRSTGSWPKPDSVTGFSWGEGTEAPYHLYFNINYKTNGWNPAYSK